MRIEAFRLADGQGGRVEEGWWRVEDEDEVRFWRRRTGTDGG